jgi:hypothetical protein
MLLVEVFIIHATSGSMERTWKLRAGENLKTIERYFTFFLIIRVGRMTSFNAGLCISSFLQSVEVCSQVVWWCCILETVRL